MGFEAYDRAEEKYQHTVDRLNAISVHVSDGHHGAFMRALAEAWLLADSANKRILRQAWAAIVVKYGLEAEAGV